ncbi:6-phosphofructokinase [Pyrinomonas methylaliphatogenes]|jgi:6-phosphofructokinase|uniref:Pyrophosphate-dependent phosphofructokinase n=1 Tax=Pyrinomonas methylaliphatogenes TaxID=454194 RepID=A0A0B6WWF2_9BACT|nr:ATP-dependent 6-phosphofructokinase [Pyrinomonas methylaliphatogenes]MBX5478974.1 ATP-dependent 6-phosphofructokinase [Pyrinomonas methylaliphatogenes]CDM65441.1 pyrophosphate-dependent phosphofructokinase [Pyrinomonas methylaliphatogenes]
MKVKRIGVLTGGGDAPGLNPAIKGLVYRASDHGISVIGLYDGWRSLLDPPLETWPLDRETVRRWDRDGGTNLGSSRTNPFKAPNEAGERVDRSDEVIKNMEKLGLDALVACGGEDTLGVAARLTQKGVPVVGVPKTIDKDLAGTDYTLGFDTALRNVTEIIEWSRNPAGSHGWVQVIEVMGRHAGHLAFWSGVAGQADLILIPEHPFSYAKVFALLRERMGDPNRLTRDPRRPRYSVIVVAEGAYAEDGQIVTLDDRQDAFGHARLGGIGEILARKIREETPYDARSAAIGHPQRGGHPSPIDRIMGLSFGARAADAIAAGDFGKMVSARGIAPSFELSLVDLGIVVGNLNTLDVARYYDTERYHAKNLGM